METFIGQFYLKNTLICDEIISYFDSYKNIVKGSNRSIDGILSVNPLYKDCWETVLDNNSELYNRYTLELQECCNQYIAKFPLCNIYSEWRIIEYINIQKYEPSAAFFQLHTERIGSVGLQASRHLVFMTYLNDVHDQGETEFIQQKILVKPKKGLTLIWPADWTHTHRGIPSQTETKYIVTGWFNYVN